MRQSGVIAAPARVAVDETFLGGKLVKSHEMARRVGEMWESKGGKLANGGLVESNMVWLDLEAAGVEVEEFVEAGVEEGVKVMGGRIVCHYQIGEEGVVALARVMDWVFGKGRGKWGKREFNGGGMDEKDESVRKKAKEVMEVEME